MNLGIESVFRIAAITSNLVTPTQLDYVLRLARHRLTAEGKPLSAPIEDQLLADIFVEQGVLTNYQAQQLCMGRTKFKLGPYITTDFIAQGGMGQVFKAVHQVMGREVAVKVLPTTKATVESRESFLREIRMQAQLDCDYLVRAHDAGQEGSVHYLVTEYVPGMDLRRLVKASGALQIHQAASIIMQAALGLDYAHKQGMVHRDVKPGNILVTPNGIAKVSDIGLAGFEANLYDDPRAGKIVGTADYLSPEQIRTPLEVGPTSDIYSLGCTLYYAICGKVPFPGGTSSSKLKRHLEDTPLHPRNFAPLLNEEFVDIIAEMMEKDSKKRIQSAAEVASRLEIWAGDTVPLTSGRMARGPWLPPPPPAWEGLAAAEAYLDAGAQDTSLSEASTSQSSIGGDSKGAGVTRPIYKINGLDNTPQAFSKGMLIALTIAIVMPPAMLIGAIIGFLAHQASVP